MKTQQDRIIALLQHAGTNGVSSYDFTFKHQIKQCPTRIYELKAQGYQIVSKPFKNSVIYILLGGTSKPEPIIAKPICTGEGCENESHYKPYIKNERRFFKHEFEPRQEALL